MTGIYFLVGYFLEKYRKISIFPGGYSRVGEGRCHIGGNMHTGF